MYCKVKGCKFPQYHLTCSHKCGKCKCYGHGVMEHTKTGKQVVSIEYDHLQTLPKDIQCMDEDCCNPYTHSTESHNSDMLKKSFVGLQYVCLYCSKKNNSYTILQDEYLEHVCNICMINKPNILMKMI